MPDLEVRKEGFNPGPGAFRDLVQLLATMGVGLPYERMRQSQYVTEAIPGTTRTTAPRANVVRGGRIDEMSMQAGYGDLVARNPFVDIRER